ncbi:MAG: hypothetical protein AAFX65_12215 [Cyanobacteria bacterium J06638_7]
MSGTGGSAAGSAPGSRAPSGATAPRVEPQAAPSGRAPSAQGRPALIETGAAASLSLERRDLVCSVIGLTVKLALVAVAGVSLVRLAAAYRERMDRQGELAAVLQIEQGRLARARERFDALFTVEGEQRLIREQNQWIAPNRLRVVWKQTPPAAPAQAPTPQPAKPATP